MNLTLRTTQCKRRLPSQRHRLCHFWIPALKISRRKSPHGRRKEEYLIIWCRIDVIFQRNIVSYPNRYNGQNSKKDKAETKMFHEIEINIGSQSKLLIYIIWRLYVSATAATCWPWWQFTAYFATWVFLQLFNTILYNELMGIERFDLFPFESVKMIGI